MQTIPILRIFSLDKAREFYVGFLGFSVDWEVIDPFGNRIRFNEDLPREDASPRSGRG